MFQASGNLWPGFAVICAIFLAAIIVCILFRKEKYRGILWLLTAGIGVLLGILLFFLLTGGSFSPSPAPSVSSSPIETSPTATAETDASIPASVPTAVPETTAPAETAAYAEGAVWYADCQEFISLRETPSTKADTITKIPVSDTMTLLGWDGDFAKVSYQGQQGYVLASYIQPLNGPKAIDLTYNGGSKRAMLYAGDGYALYIPITGWDRTENGAAVTWKSSSGVNAALTITSHAGTDVEALRTQLMGEYDTFSLWEDKRGNLTGEDTKGTTTLTILLYPLPDGVLTVTARYPISAAETVGYELSAITDSIMITAE